ncbi:putative CDP-alcohol phosphatidyltransferase class-I family protein C22A12.08c [Diplonema papillatum]|nr:putative CDP-alcohol phosphatidyltransferase class-I family protein C22A12.08c [Diplonema papillatum]
MAIRASCYRAARPVVAGVVAAQRRTLFPSTFQFNDELQIAPEDRLRIRQQYHADTHPAWPLNGTAGVVVSIDGVLQRGGRVLPGVVQAVASLRSADIPMLFYSNAFPAWTEEAMASNLAAALQSSVSSEEVVLSSASMLREFVTPKEGPAQKGELRTTDRVLVVGPPGSVAKVRSLGFEKAVGVDGVAKHFPSHVPKRWLFAPRDGGVALEPSEETYIIDSIVIVGEPADWQSSLQICLDVLFSKGSTGSVKNLRTVFDAEQNCPVFCTDRRVVSSDLHPIPRISTGTFVSCLEGMYTQMNCHRSLNVTDFGRGNAGAQVYLENRLRELSHNMGHTLDMSHIFSVTDNLDYDASAVGAFRDSPLESEKWWSVLTSGESNDGNKTVGLRTVHDLNEGQDMAVLSLPARMKLKKYLEDRRVDAAYHSFPMFVADLLSLEYHPSSDELRRAQSS